MNDGSEQLEMCTPIVDLFPTWKIAPDVFLLVRRDGRDPQPVTSQLVSTFLSTNGFIPPFWDSKDMTKEEKTLLDIEYIIRQIKQDTSGRLKEKIIGLSCELTYVEGNSEDFYKTYCAVGNLSQVVAVKYIRFGSLRLCRDKIEETKKDLWRVPDVFNLKSLSVLETCFPFAMLPTAISTCSAIESIVCDWFPNVDADSIEDVITSRCVENWYDPVPLSALPYFKAKLKVVKTIDLTKTPNENRYKYTEEECITCVLDHELKLKGIEVDEYVSDHTYLLALLQHQGSLKAILTYSSIIIKLVECERTPKIFANVQSIFLKDYEEVNSRKWRNSITEKEFEKIFPNANIKDYRDRKDRQMFLNIITDGIELIWSKIQQNNSVYRKKFPIS